MTSSIEDLLRAAWLNHAQWISVGPHTEGAMATVRYGPAKGSACAVARDPIIALRMALENRPNNEDARSKWAAAMAASRGAPPAAEPPVADAVVADPEDIFA